MMAAAAIKNHKILAIDIEAKGGMQSRCDMLCFGACVGDSQTGKIDEDDTFEVYIQHRNGEDKDWEQRCLDEFWEGNPENRAIKNAILKRIREEGVGAETAMKAFVHWVQTMCLKHGADSLVVFTDTAGFDIGFLNHYLSEANIPGVPSMNYIIGGQYKPTRDSSSYHMGVGLQTPPMGLWGAEKAACSAFGKSKEEVLGHNPYVADHTPLNDAKNMCWEIMQIQRLVETGIRK